VLAQGFGKRGEAELLYLSFPFPDKPSDDWEDLKMGDDATEALLDFGLAPDPKAADKPKRHRPSDKSLELAAQLRQLPQVGLVRSCVDIEHNIGYLTLARQRREGDTDQDTTVNPGWCLGRGETLNSDGL
jgi:hypothetical protein